MPEFEIVTKRESKAKRKPRRERRVWRPLIDALAANADTETVIFVTDTEVTSEDIKYLALALARRGKSERLRTQREHRSNVSGRLLWVEVTPSAPAGP